MKKTQLLKFKKKLLKLLLLFLSSTCLPHPTPVVEPPGHVWPELGSFAPLIKTPFFSKSRKLPLVKPTSAYTVR